ncbi:MAG: hypothetical protein GY708_15890 [Actinomycetia bacterium]|nr:hypothetical protein [Actinomycetes bacterium]MCP4960745.1 hypothetical protein [Actinomycetes bacterium]
MTANGANREFASGAGLTDDTTNHAPGGTVLDPFETLGFGSFDRLFPRLFGGSAPVFRSIDRDEMIRAEIPGVDSDDGILMIRVPVGEVSGRRLIPVGHNAA